MATKKKPRNKKLEEAGSQPVSFSVEPGTRVQITLDVGEKDGAGKVPLTVHIEQVGRVEQITNEPPPAEDAPQPEATPVHSPVVIARSRGSGFESLMSRLKTYDLAVWLFLLAIVVYLGTRLIGLTQFPMYFFTDEAIQTQSI